LLHGYVPELRPFLVSKNDWAKEEEEAKRKVTVG